MAEHYKQLLENNKQYIVEPPTTVKCQDFSKKLFYTRLASIPVRYESFWNELDAVKQAWKNIPDQVCITSLFGLELYGWFCIGEIVGGGFTFTGYYV